MKVGFVYGLCYLLSAQFSISQQICGVQSCAYQPGLHFTQVGHEVWYVPTRLAACLCSSASVGIEIGQHGGYIVVETNYRVCMRYTAGFKILHDKPFLAAMLPFGHARTPQYVINRV